MKFINSIILNLRNLRLAMSLAFAFVLVNAAWGAQLIQSVEVSPNPLVAGRTFSISVVASPDVTQARARIDFRPGVGKTVDVQLTRLGGLWVGTGLVPSDIRREIPADVGAQVRVSLSDAAGNQDELLVLVGVRIETISAALADGILTITGDE